jgi:hypothetical protein
METFADAVPDGDFFMAVSLRQCHMEILVEAVADGDHAMAVADGVFCLKT